MKLRIDIRERQLIKLLQAFNKTEKVKYDIILENLPLGDAIICDDTGKELLILERKSLTDLGSSITDGRYREQSMRLHHEKMPNHNIMYIIEGHMDNFVKKNYSSRINENTLYSAMFTLNYFKGFSVIRTFDVLETATWIIRMIDKLSRSKEKEGYFLNASDKDTNITMDTNSQSNEEVNAKSTNSTDGVQTESANTNIKHRINHNINRSNDNVVYSSVVKRVKKDNITPENVGEIILSQIPGISTATSLAIMKHFGSLYQLMIALKDDKTCLDRLKYTTKSGQQRHISSKAIKSIITYLLYQKENVIYVNTES